jgi:predicted KAP-like P-loop ATPase
MLNDNETSLDLLNNKVVAQTILKTISDSASEPVTIGVHGDWGAGKSSVLRMIEDEVGTQDDVVCLWFNGWLFQGFEDAKIILIETIVHKLLKARPKLTKVKHAAKKVLKKLDWLRIAKHGGGLAWTAITGIPSPDQISGAMDFLKGLLPSEPKEISSASVEEAIGKVGDALKGAESHHVSQEVLEFRESLQELLAAAEVTQLIVLIDDLDRCLPETSIEILEALRLFLLIPGAAFVIAADEVMIEYAVKQHFPDLPYSERAKNYTRSYLEKLIHVPFRLPPLGLSETRIYVTLLLLMSEIGVEDERFTVIAKKGLDLMRMPWACDGFTRDDLEKALNSKFFAELESCFALGNMVGKALARGTKGNPRQIKRFLNAYLLRQSIAEARGLGDMIEPSVLAKLMLAEQFLPKIYQVIVSEASVSENGRSLTMVALENANQQGGGDEEDEGQDAPTPLAELDEAEYHEWAKLSPFVSEIDFRPYLFIARDKQRVLFDGNFLGDLGALAQILMESKIQAVQAGRQIKALTPAEVRELCGLLREEILSSGNYTKKPAGISGFKVLAELREEARGELFELLNSLPPDEVGPWIATGWQTCLPDAQYQAGLGDLFNKLQVDGSDALKKVLKFAASSLKKS